jgi:type I restriction enzyme, S subunit
MAIAETLSEMDAEIAALEGKLSKARQVKHGMMSVLLTPPTSVAGQPGRVRLV